MRPSKSKEYACTSKKEADKSQWLAEQQQEKQKENGGMAQTH